MKQSLDAIVILEDNPARVKIMRDVVATLPGGFELWHFDSVEALRAGDLRGIRLISLDFSLENSSARKPGTGMDAVDFLIKRRAPVCPVIVHTSSAGDSRKMAEALERKGWSVKRVDFGSSDRAEKWRSAAMELMGFNKSGQASDRGH